MSYFTGNAFALSRDHFLKCHHSTHFKPHLAIETVESFSDVQQDTIITSGSMSNIDFSLPCQADTEKLHLLVGYVARSGGPPQSCLTLC